MRKIVASFNPSWGAAVMGTGVLSIIFAGLGSGFAIAAYALFWLNSLVLFYALACWLLMWFLTPAKIRSMVQDANSLVFLPTVPVGVVVYANNLLALRVHFFPSLSPLLPAVLWIASSLIIVGLSVYFIDRVFDSAKIEIRHSTFGWLIPPVALLVIPLGAPGIVGVFGPATAGTIVVFSYALWGAGFFAYLFVNAAVTHRYFFHEMPVNQMTPSVWVGLGPLGAGAAGLLALSRVSRSMPALKSVSDIGDGLALLLWGFGIVWYLVSLALTIRKAVLEKIPYTMGWWAFTFPLGAYVLATRMLFLQTGLATLRVIFWILLANLVVFWLLTVYRTARVVIEARHGAPPDTNSLLHSKEGRR